MNPAVQRIYEQVLKYGYKIRVKYYYNNGIKVETYWENAGSIFIAGYYILLPRIEDAVHPWVIVREG